ncbi:MAG: McrC family protein [Bacteroides sp.]|nr:McrC family protein [Bacteroides sp.]
MIYLFEQYGYERTGFYDGLSDAQLEKLSCLKESGFTKHIMRKNKQESCLFVDFDNKKNKYHFQTSYYVGVDWIVENEQPIYIQPKLSNELLEVDYLGMLLEALQETENLKHLEDLVHIDFHKPYIPITQKQDLLSPFLIAQFLQILRKIVQKGLKKSYYTVTENLNARIKGKILVEKNIKENLVKGRQTHTICQYQEFGVNSDENKILKKAYQFSRHVIQQKGKGFDTRPLLELINYVHPAFETVTDDIDIRKLKNFKSNPLFKEYDQAIKLALLILKRFSYNITKTEQQQIMTPPFWIDMSKLFELYVYKKLRSVFSSDEVKYHIKANRQELDFIIRSKDKSYIFIVDTKYKPRYENHNVSPEDIRQVSGYARIKKVYDELGCKDYDKVLDCLVVYSHQDCSEELTKEHFTLSPEKELKKMRAENGYVKFYKLGIKLPEITKQNSIES